MSPVIEVRQLHKRYGDTVAVDDISFTVAEGEVFGVLGPNGAGKTTTVECIEGLRAPDRGTVSVLGLDPGRDRAELSQRLGVQLQDSQLPDKLRVDEALGLYSSFYRNPADWRALVDMLGLADKTRTRFGKLSGGQKQRLQPRAIYGGESFLDLYTTIMVVFGLALLALTNMPMILADYRERGVLRRLRTTPIGPVRVLAAQLVADLVVSVVMVALILAVARIGFAVPLPRQAGGFILAALLAAAALLGAGLLVAAIAPTGRVARGIGALVFYPMMFFAGLWLPIPNMPATLQHVSHATPLGAAVPALTAAAFGSWPTAPQLLAMAGWAVAFGLAAARFFRWE